MFISGTLIAQDIHFSQFYNSPLTLNPALTGRMNGKYRVAAIYRNQWFGPVNGNTSFSTPSASFDMPIRLKKDVIGVGGYFVSDRSSEGNLKNNLFMASAAYHKSIGMKHAISLGVQLGYGNKELSLSNIRFASQFDAQQNFDATRSGENLKNTSKGAFDVNVGLLYSANFSEKFSLYAGGSIFHVTTPEQNFTNSNEETPERYVGNAGFNIGLTDKISLNPSLIYMNQASAEEINTGLSVSLKFSEQTALHLGTYYRFDDAVIPYVGADYKGFSLGLSYDANTSKLNNTNGSIELSLIYISRYVAVPDVNPALYCPRF